MAGQGPAHLFVYYQKPYKLNEQGDVEEIRSSSPEFQVTDGKSAAQIFGKWQFPETSHFGLNF